MKSEHLWVYANAVFLHLGYHMGDLSSTSGWHCTVIVPLMQFSCLQSTITETSSPPTFWGESAMKNGIFLCERQNSLYSQAFSWRFWGHFPRVGTHSRSPTLVIRCLFISLWGGEGLKFQIVGWVHYNAVTHTLKIKELGVLPMCMPLNTGQNRKGGGGEHNHWLDKSHVTVVLNCGSSGGRTDLASWSQ